MTVKHWGGEAGIAWFNAHICCSGAWDTMISYMALISTLGMMRRKVLANPVPNGIKMKVLPQVEVTLVDNKRWNKIVKNQIKFIEVVKEWMHGYVMENVRKIKIRLENIWIDLIRSIYAPYREFLSHFNYTIMHIDGVDNKVVDCLSCYYENDMNDMSDNTHLKTPMSMQTYS